MTKKLHFVDTQMDFITPAPSLNPPRDKNSEMVGKMIPARRFLITKEPSSFSSTKQVFRAHYPDMRPLYMGEPTIDQLKCRVEDLYAPLRVEFEEVV